MGNLSTKEGSASRETPNEVIPFGMSMSFGSEGASVSDDSEKPSENAFLHVLTDTGPDPSRRRMIEHEWSREEENPFVELDVLPAHERSVNILIPVDERRIVSGSIDGLLIVWDCVKGTILSVLGDHDKCVNAGVVFHEERTTYLITACTDHRVIIWDIDAGVSVAAFTHHSGAVSCLSSTVWEGERIFATGGTDNVLGIVNASKRELSNCVLREDEETVSALCWIKSSLLAVGASGPDILLYDMQELLLVDRLEGHQDSVQHIVPLQSQSRRFVSGSVDGRVIVWSSDSFQRVYEFNVGGGGLFLPPSAPGHSFLGAAFSGFEDTKTGSQTAEKKHQETKSIDAGGVPREKSKKKESSSRRTSSAESGKTLPESFVHVQRPDPISCVVPLRDNLMFAAANHRFVVWDVMDQKRCWRRDEAHEALITNAAWLSGVQKIVTVSQACSVALWDLPRDDEMLRHLGVDGKKDAKFDAASAKKRMKKRDRMMDRMPFRLENFSAIRRMGFTYAHGGGIRSVVQLDGRSFCTGGMDGLVVIWRDRRHEEKKRSLAAENCAGSELYALQLEPTEDGATEDIPPDPATFVSPERRRSAPYVSRRQEETSVIVKQRQRTRGRSAKEF
eukprot:TRINITY_DN51632_c0_g1_i1.p1 TRINITY_DN51632_c0_g1~~TRINITY_DN51632_c0_g1_i1.p1  ORF type:complete len:619 (-),score=178.81 TRINITY_DN51632_c0_g1_i1:72-1928(-)